jgi:hypothetical protein
MPGFCRVYLPALLILSAGALPAWAEVVLQVPYVTLRVGTPARPGGPLIRVQVPPWVDVQVRPAPVASPVAPRAPGPVTEASAPAVIAPASLDQRPITHREFAQRFQPAEGFYEVLFVHPDTGRPVIAHFTLPEGEPRRVRVFRRQLHFDYGKSEVRIRFEPRGGVYVDYR